MHLEGRCLCGAVTYAFDGEPVVTALCHCANCQRQTGTMASIVVGVPVDAFMCAARPCAPSRPRRRPRHEHEPRFCSACGSPVVTYVDAIPGLAWIKAGTLDDASWPQPTVELARVRTPVGAGRAGSAALRARPGLSPPTAACGSRIRPGRGSVPPSPRPRGEPMRVGILDILTLPARHPADRLYHALIAKQFASIMPQAISVWCRRAGHETFYATYYGAGDAHRLLPPTSTSSSSRPTPRRARWPTRSRAIFRRTAR